MSLVVSSPSAKPMRSAEGWGAWASQGPALRLRLRSSTSPAQSPCKPRTLRMPAPSPRVVGVPLCWFLFPPYEVGERSPSTSQCPIFLARFCSSTFEGLDSVPPPVLGLSCSARDLGMEEGVLHRAGPAQLRGFTALPPLTGKPVCSVPAFGPHFACSCDFFQPPLLFLSS